MDLLGNPEGNDMAKRILVADDSVTIQQAFALVFDGEDVALDRAMSLEDALNAARKNKPDLVIADAGLGSRTGYDLCSSVKGDPALRDVPVYILASTQVPYDEARGRQAGASGHFIKPFESHVIVDKVLDAIGRSVSTTAAVTASDLPAMGMPAGRDRDPVTAKRPTGKPFDSVEDSYGELKIERASSPAISIPSAASVSPARPQSAPVPSSPAPSSSAPRPAAPAPAAPSMTARPMGLRPSLIPGAQAPAPAPSGKGHPTGPIAIPPAATTSTTRNTGGSRTMMGLPAQMPHLTPSGAQPAAQARGYAPAPSPFAPVPPASSPQAPAAPAVAPVSPALTPPSPMPGASGPPPATAPSAMPASMAAAMSSAVAAKVAEIAAKGPEYEAIAKLSREIIEQIVWEVVPELAEVIIRQEVDRLAKK
jgi:CheY-like chemotaxis protein